MRGIYGNKTITDALSGITITYRYVNILRHRQLLVAAVGLGENEEALILFYYLVKHEL